MPTTMARSAFYQFRRSTCWTLAAAAASSPLGPGLRRAFTTRSPPKSLRRICSASLRRARRRRSVAHVQAAVRRRAGGEQPTCAAA